jgi:hypothetical protein
MAAMEVAEPLLPVLDATAMPTAIPEKAEAKLPVASEALVDRTDSTAPLGLVETPTTVATQVAAVEATTVAVAVPAATAAVAVVDQATPMPTVLQIPCIHKGQEMEMVKSIFPTPLLNLAKAQESPLPFG